MQNKFKNKYRISSARLQSWDYSNSGVYFITICTQDRHHFFGHIHNQEMQLSEVGKLAAQFWYEIPNHFPMVELGNFVVMPNHVHGILIIDNSQIPVETRLIASDNYDEINNSRLIASDNDDVNNNIDKTRLIASIQGEIGGFSGDKNPMLGNSISKIVRWYKGRCSFECRKIQSNFAWQSRFYDHIIRNSKSFDTIQNYIEQNPLKWKEDTFYSNSPST
ncbi:transposase [Flavobacterium sp. HXWNR69]|uniref:Transposase n=1 Tax=Flavobacterium fragile TaxID=2949085 RepID=A0ABT0TJG5_9FLAO|nr:transposase [Flavobacterium sp. HXWNR69]MCL9771131.1 transposase [Flavobacterium sp. HXWNR69]